MTATPAARPTRQPSGAWYDTEQYSRVMPDEPELGYELYRLWGLAETVHTGARLQVLWSRARDAIAAWLFGPVYVLIYVGITSRASLVRWLEHIAQQPWHREISTCERDESVRFPTLAAAEEYEDWRIKVECPKHNRKGNERALNPGAVHLSKRILPRHVAMWRRAAALLLLCWLFLAAARVYLASLAGGVSAALDAVPDALPDAAAVIVAAQVLRLLCNGAGVGWSKRWASAKRDAARRRRRGRGRRGRR